MALVLGRTFQSWLESESKARVRYGYWFEYKTRSLFPCATDEDVEVKALEANEDLSKDEQDHLTNILSEVKRSQDWKIPKFKEVQCQEGQELQSDGSEESDRSCCAVPST